MKCHKCKHYAHNYCHKHNDIVGTKILQECALIYSLQKMNKNKYYAGEQNVKHK